MIHDAALALGSSLGDSATSLRLVVHALDATPGLRVVHASRVYATPPAGGVARGTFLNAALRCRTTLAPLDLLAVCKGLEVKLGRRPVRRWGDRVLDVDILLYDRAVIELSGLRIPHPRLAERDFLLAALADAWPDAPNPWTGASWASALPARRAWPVVGVLPNDGGLAPARAAL